MKVTTLLNILGLMLMISGCLTDPEVKAKRQEERNQELFLDHNQCVSYGFPPGTVEYSNCRMKLDQQRIEMEHQKQLQEQNIQGNTQAVKQTQNPDKICNAHSCY
jgi:hypothetical protein